MGDLEYDERAWRVCRSDLSLFKIRHARFEAVWGWGYQAVSACADGRRLADRLLMLVRSGMTETNHGFLGEGAMKRLSSWSFVILAPLWLTSCATHGDLVEHFVANPPSGWVEVGQSGPTAYFVPVGEDAKSPTKKFRIDFYHADSFTPITSWSTSLVDTNRESDCPDMFEVREPVSTENGFHILVSAYYCPYSKLTDGGLVEVIKMIQGRRNNDIYSAAFLIPTPSFKPGEKPVDFNVKEWERLLEPIQVCTGASCK